MPFGTTPRGLGLALDLLNTVRREEGRIADALATPHDLVAWLGARGLGSGRLEALRASPPDSALLLLETRRLRDATARAVEAHREGAEVPADALYAIDRVLAASRVARRLEPTPKGPRVRDEEVGEHPLAVLAPIALGAAELLTTADPKRVRRCASSRCAEWFVDTSKGGRRRWCSMERCGNRAKAAGHRRRRRAPG